ncbi:MAG TPA: MarR family transcriptional regulator [Cellulomonas sp.]
MNDPVAGEEKPARDDLVDALVRTAHATMAVLTRVGAENDLSMTQMRALAILRGRRLRMTALADYLGLEKSTMTGLVDRAERRGLVARAPSADDRRAVDVLLTPAGIELGEHVGPRVAAELSALTGRLTPDERTAVRELLERMLDGRDE